MKLRTGEMILAHIPMIDKGNRFIQERVPDPYRLDVRLPEPTVCSGCGAVYQKGRWQWAGPQSKIAPKIICTACRRIQDNTPAGILSLSGDFFRQHYDEVMHLTYHTVAEQKAHHPLKRIMGISNTIDGGVLIAFTDKQLPYSVGQAIRKAYKGDLQIEFSGEADIIRVSWDRQE